MEPARIFPDEYVPREQASATHKKWEQSNPNGDAPKWRAYRDKVLAYKKGDPAIAPPDMATPHGDALVAAGKLHVSVTDIGAVWEPPPLPPIDPPPVPGGTLRFHSNFETSNVLNEWDGIPTTPNDSFHISIVTAAGGVTPREGTRMFRSQVNSSQWLAGTNGALIQRSLGAMSIPIGQDVYTGLSLFIPSGFSPAPGQLANNLWEYHWNSSSVQAPFHFGINSLVSPPQLYCDLHTVSDTSYNPIFTTNVGLLSDNWGKWINVVLRYKGSTGSDGRYQLWMRDSGTGQMASGNLKKDFTGKTWASSGVSVQYLLCGIYRANSSWNSTCYYDCVRVGDNLPLVDPGSYS